MDLNEIKEIIEADGGKFIIVEEGRPTLMVMSFEDYKKNLEGRGQKELLKKETKKTEAPKKESKSPASPPLPEEELTVEDLPF